jgi:hypothetical protein
MSVIKRILSPFRNFLFSYTNREFLFFLFFLFLSAAFWLSISLKETYESEIDVPISLVNVPKNAIIINNIDDTLRVVIRDDGFALLSYKFSDRIHPVKIDFNTYADRHAGVGVVPMGDIQKILNGYIYNSSRITSIKYNSLKFTFNFGLKKLLPIQVAGKLITARSYYLSHVAFSPERVTVYGSRGLLDSLRSVFTMPLNIRNFNDTIVRKVRLQHIRGAKIEPSEVTIMIYPDILTEESIDVPIAAVNMPENKVLRMFPSHVRVQFTVGMSRFHSLRPENFRVVADYDDIILNSSDKCSLRLTRVPSDVSNAHLVTSQVDYLIEQQ